MTQVTQKFLPEVPAHDAVDEDPDGGVEGHQETGDHADDDEPALRGEAIDLAHVDVRNRVPASQGVENCPVVWDEHVTQLFLQK